MVRYQGEVLSESARVALVGNDALGNYAVITPLLRMLRGRYPKAQISYFSGNRTREFWAGDTKLHEGHDVLSLSPLKCSQLLTDLPAFDLVINVEQATWAKWTAALLAKENGYVVGPCLGPDLRGDLPFADDAIGRLCADPQWIAEDLRERYPFLDSGFIGEIFCRMAYLNGPLPAYSIPWTQPGLEIPDVLIATAASLPEKLWLPENWRKIVQELQDAGRSVGLLGAKPGDQQRYWKGNSDEEDLVRTGLIQDLRGRLSLPEVAGAIRQAKLVITIDNGILHLAASTETPVVGLFRHGIHRLWAPPFGNVSVLTPRVGKSVAEISISDVLKEIKCALKGSSSH